MQFSSFINHLRIPFVLAALFMFFSQTARAQPAGSIEGQVTDTRQKPVPDINISLEGTHYGAATNGQGFYEIDPVPAGEYTLVVSGVGYQSQEKSITVEPGEKLSINVMLSASSEALQEIMVRSSRVNKFSVPASDYVAKLPIKNLDNPQVYNTITSGLLEEQVVTSFSDALKNAPGIFKLWGSTGRGGDGAGYYSLRGFAVQPTMVNGLPSLTNGVPDPANIERIEIIKGPSGTLYGSGLISYGGLINIITKKPYPSPKLSGEVSFKTGSRGLNRVTADINTPVGGNENVTVRVNGAFHTQNSFQDAGFKKSAFIAPSLSYRVNERLSFLILTDYYHSEMTNPPMIFLNRSTPLVDKNLNELNYNNEYSYTSNNITITNPTFSLQGQMIYKLSDSWTSRTALSRSSAKADGYYTYLWDLADANSTYTRFASRQNSTTLGTDIQQNFIGDFSIGGLHNRMVAGVDYFYRSVINNSSGYVPIDQITMQDAASPPGLTRSAVDTALAEAAVVNTTTEQHIYSAYISDVIDFTPRLSAMLSLRVDHYDNTGDTSSEDDDYTQTALSPKFGLIYQPVPEQLSLFANYMNGFKNVAPRMQDDGSIKTFSPEQANQWEVGIKANLFNNRLTGVLSYYDIRVTDIVMEDPGRINFYIQEGEVYSRGFEASITAAPLPGLNIIAGYSYNKSEITKTDSDEYRGRRPEGAGPEHLINGWVSYEVSEGILEGLGVGFGGNYASENVILNRASTGAFALPVFTVLNASIFYDTATYRLDLKVNNFADEEYYKGWNTINPQPPRNVTASFSYKF